METDVEIDAIKRENFYTFQKYLLTLPACKRDILILRVWQDLPFREIAAILNQSEGQCKMTFYRLIEKMKQELPAAMVLLLVVTKHIIR